MRRAKRFLLSGLLLTVTTLFIRTVGVGYNIYLSGKLGAAGMGLFSLIMTVYNLAVTFGTSGISFAAMRMTAEAIGMGESATVRPIMRRCLLYGMTFGLASMLLLTCISGPVGRTLLGDGRTVRSLRLLAPSLPFLSLSTAIHGYFNAVHRVPKSAAVQVAGQLFRIAVTVTALSFSATENLESACACVSFGAAFGEVFSCALLGLLYTRDLRRHIPHSESEKSGLTRAMLHITLPMAISAYTRSGLLTAEHLLIPYGLRRSGVSAETALADYGTVHGMVFPLVLFPQAFLGAFCGLLIPEVAEEKARGNMERIRSIIRRVFATTLLFSFGCAGVMICFSSEFGNTVYASEAAGRYIRLVAPLIPVMYLDGAVDSILKGLGEQLYCMRVNIIDSLLSVVFAWLLLPIWGLQGYLVSVYICELINAALSIARLVKVGGVSPSLLRMLLLPLLSVFGATASVRVLFGLAHIVIPNDVCNLIVHAALSAIIYLLLLLATRCLNRDDLHWMRGLLHSKKEGRAHVSVQAAFFPFFI